MAGHSLKHKVMKKLLILLFLYILVEGNNIISDGLYVWHRGKHAVDELATKVDDYYPKVQAIDTVMTNAINKEFNQMRDSVKTREVTTRESTPQRPVIRRK